MDYPLADLHRVRELREQVAQADLAEGRRLLDRADKELFRERTHLENHRLRKAKIQNRLFNEIDRREVTLNEIERYRGKISDLRVEEENQQEKVRQAQLKKTSAREKVDHLSDILQKRYREHTKLKEFRNAWDIEVNDENERRTEEEVDEMTMGQFYGNDTDRGLIRG